MTIVIIFSTTITTSNITKFLSDSSFQFELIEILTFNTYDVPFHFTFKECEKIASRRKKKCVLTEKHLLPLILKK